MEQKPLNNQNNINVSQNPQNAPIPIQNNAPPYISGQAIIVQQPYVVPVASNQVFVATLNSEIFKLDPVFLNCPFCHQNVTTSVETSFSFCACCLCMCTGLTIYLCIQLCRGKDICCKNAIHICPSCGKQLGYYSAI